MYFNKLYRQNKWWGIAVLAFAVVQLGNNIRQDIAISPFYGYGMYSEKMTADSVYQVYEISVNKKILLAKDYSPQQWDNIMQPVILFYKQQQWNGYVWQTDIRRLLPFTDSANYMNHFSEPEFRVWYQQRLHQYTNTIIDQLIIKETIYHPPYLSTTVEK